MEEDQNEANYKDKLTENIALVSFPHISGVHKCDKPVHELLGLALNRLRARGKW